VIMIRTLDSGKLNSGIVAKAMNESVMKYSKIAAKRNIQSTINSILLY
jgi:hypothetical protein